MDNGLIKSNNCEREVKTMDGWVVRLWLLEWVIEWIKEGMEVK